MVMLRSQSSAAAGAGLTRTGVLIPSDFYLDGGKRKAIATITPPFTDSNYVVSISVETVGQNYAPVHEDRTALSFVVNLGTASLAGLASVTWSAEPVR